MKTLYDAADQYRQDQLGLQKGKHPTRKDETLRKYGEALRTWAGELEQKADEGVRRDRLVALSTCLADLMVASSQGNEEGVLEAICYLQWQLLQTAVEYDLPLEPAVSEVYMSLATAGGSLARPNAEGKEEQKTIEFKPNFSQVLTNHRKGVNHGTGVSLLRTLLSQFINTKDTNECPPPLDDASTAANG